MSTNQDIKVCYGDVMVLCSNEANGFVHTAAPSGSSGQVGLHCLSARATHPVDIRACLFMLTPKYIYDSQHLLDEELKNEKADPQVWAVLCG